MLNCFKPWIYNFNLIVIYRYTCTHFLFRMKTKCIIYIVFRLFESLKLYKIHKIHINKTLKALSNSKNKSLPILSFLVQFFQFVNNFLCLHVLPVHLVRIPNPTKNIRSGEGGGGGGLIAEEIRESYIYFLSCREKWILIEFLSGSIPLFLGKNTGSAAVLNAMDIIRKLYIATVPMSS